MLYRTITFLFISLFIQFGEASPSQENSTQVAPNQEVTYGNADLTVTKDDVVNKELAYRKEIEQTLFELFFANKFEELDAYAESLVTENTSSGVSSYSRFMYSMNALTRMVMKQDDVEGMQYLEQQFDYWEDSFEHSNHAKLAKLSYLVQVAWFYRGGGYANTVSDAEFKLFHQYLTIAENYAQQIKLEVNNPHWYVQMLQIYKGLGMTGEEYILLAQTGISLYPNFYEVYFRAADYLSPKWHGNETLLENFMRMSAENLSATNGISIYARIFWTQHHPSRELLFNRELMRASMFEVVNKYPDEWNIQNLAKIACDINETSTARALLQLMSEQPMKVVWRNQTRYETCLRIANLSQHSA